eukprot:scaffold261107_cov17-Prasinocladus_malaysianus.AAC.1
MGDRISHINHPNSYGIFGRRVPGTTTQTGSSNVYGYLYPLLNEAKCTRRKPENIVRTRRLAATASM